VYSGTIVKLKDDSSAEVEGDAMVSGRGILMVTEGGGEKRMITHDEEEWNGNSEWMRF